MSRCQDREVPRVKAAIEARGQHVPMVGGKPDQEAAERLKELLDLTRPALVAEIWSGRKQEEGAASRNRGCRSTTPAPSTPVSSIAPTTAWPTARAATP